MLKSLPGPIILTTILNHFHSRPQHRFKKVWKMLKQTRKSIYSLISVHLISKLTLSFRIILLLSLIHSCSIELETLQIHMCVFPLFGCGYSSIFYGLRLATINPHSAQTQCMWRARPFLFK